MLVCYLDDSGSDRDTPTATLAGYMAAIPAWAEFETAAADVFDREGVEVLHAKLFHHSKGVFRSWGLGKKQAFAEEIYSLLRPRVTLGVAFSTVKKAYATAKAETGMARQTSPFGFSFMALANLLLQDPATRRMLMVDGYDISFVVEGGNKNDGDIARMFNEVKRSLQERDGLGHKFASISFVDKRHTIAVQMADFLAFHCSRLSTAMERSGRTKRGSTPMDRAIFSPEIRYLAHTGFAFHP